MKSAGAGALGALVAGVAFGWSAWAPWGVAVVACLLGYLAGRAVEFIASRIMTYQPVGKL